MRRLATTRHRRGPVGRSSLSSRAIMPAPRAPDPGARRARRRRTRSTARCRAAAPIAGAARRVVEQAGERRRPPSPTSSGLATTRPVTPSTTASAAPPDCAGHLRHAARRGLDEHDAEALLLEAAPPVAAQHGEHVGAAVQRAAGRRWRPDRGSAPARRSSRGQPPQARRVAAAAGDRQQEVRAACGAAGDGPDRGVEALARHEPADADDQLAVDAAGRSAARAAPRSSSSSGRKRSVSTPGRHDGDRQRAGRRRARPRPPGSHRRR